MSTENAVIVQELFDALRDTLGLKLVAGATGFRRSVSDPEVQRPGLALAGFLDYFSSRNVQIVGKTEIAFMSTREPEVMKGFWSEYLRMQPPAIVVARGLELPPPMVASADEQGVPVFNSPLKTEEIVHRLELWLERELAPSAMMHGVLMDVFGLGTLILGDSGVGKSETALELLQRGQRLVSDDIVEVRRMRQDKLVGTSPDLTKHHIEIRGLGILNIRQLYGASAVVDEMEIDIVAQLETWREDYEYDRLGLDQEKTEILGIEVPSILVPVQPGRNLAIIIEVGAMNQRLKNMGVHAAAEFNRRLNDMLMQPPAGPSGAKRESAK
jgi:HPr kinase/phosphorylase